MDTSSQLERLLAFAQQIATESDPHQLLDTALPAVLDIADARAGFVLGRNLDGVHVSARVGADLDDTPMHHLMNDSEPITLAVEVPSGWARTGISKVSVRRLPGATGLLVLAWQDEHPEHWEALALALATLEGALTRALAESELTDVVARMDNAQKLANMGDYDWHIATDTNTWSDQLYRIYGHEPRSFNASYEKFLSLIHPDDRERISGVHQQAYASGEPYKMIERIVRPNGEVRHLSSNGQVHMDEEGVPVRMRGTCVDITDRVLAEEERAHTAARFQGLVDAAPDAILVLDEDHRVVEANGRATQLLGGDARGHRIPDLVPSWPDGGSTSVPARDLAGADLLLDLTIVHVPPGIDAGTDDGGLEAVFLRDARTRLDGEAMAARLGEVNLRRRQALEINDNVVQGLVAATYALDDEQLGSAAAYLHGTLSAARAMMDDLLEPLDGEELQAGDLVRMAPAAVPMRRTVEERS